MPRLISVLLISSLSFSLASCASTPSSDRLTSGIDKTQLAQSTSTKRTVADPVCVDFYNNIAEYRKEAAASQGKRSFMNRLGLNVVSAVALGQVIPAGAGGAGQIATRTAAGTVAGQGKQIALQELDSADRVDAKIIKVADNIGCPVKVKP